MKTVEEFLWRWRHSVSAILAKGYKIDEIEVCLGEQTVAQFGEDETVKRILGEHRVDSENVCYWAGIRVRLADAPRACTARVRMSVVKARQRARK